MCRIAGIIAKGLPVNEITRKVRLMCDAQKHGGPDDEGFFTDEKHGLVFGHRRLSIIDLSNFGHQPMADTEKKVWITFNGEIYNYPELKELLLKAGAKFQSNSDTEVILAAYIVWGTAAFSKFRGMFAFALYDVEKATTYLVRGSGGIKPLYYHAQNGALSFASEVSAFKTAGVVTEADKNWQIRFLAHGHIPEPYTTLKDVYSLQKGYFLSWNHSDSSFAINRYWDERQPTEYITDVDTAKQLIGETLRKAVTRQLIADAPIGVFLSGGIDSSLITLLANEQKGQELKTISIYFNEKSFNERAFQNIVLDKINGEKFAHLVQQKDFDSLFPNIMRDMDMPTTDGINTWFISKYAHDDGLKAVLSGVGADELFGGYPSFNRIKYLGYLHKLPSWLLKISGHLLPDHYKRLTSLSTDHPAADYMALRGFFPVADISALLETSVDHIHDVLFGSTLAPAPSGYDYEHAAWFETNFYMQNQLLRDTDVMGMSHGLEVRVPFLDEDFTQAARSITPGIRFNKTQPKKILIDSFNNLIPREIWDRPKMGFTFPLQNWMNGHSQIGSIDNYKGKAVQNIIKQFKSNNIHWSKAFALHLVQHNE